MSKKKKKKNDVKTEEPAGEKAPSPEKKTEKAADTKAALSVPKTEEDERPVASVRSVVITVIAALAAALAAALLIAHFVFGWTYMRYTTENGVSIVFVGKVDSNILPVRGRFRYSNGLTGYVNAHFIKPVY